MVFYSLKYDEIVVIDATSFALYLYGGTDFQQTVALCGKTELALVEFDDWILIGAF